MPEPVIIKVGADLGELTAKLESIQSQLDELKGTARQPGEELRKSFTGATGAMNEVKMSAKQLDAEIRAVTESMKKTNDPKAIAALKEYRQELIQEEQQLGKTTQKFESVRGKIMAIKNELFKLSAEGKQGTQRFQELTVELARLGNMKDDINELGRALSSDTRHIDGMIQGVQGLVGAFSIFQGVQMLVGSENKEFQKAMMKMMATMQILNGVQQVANILQKESAFMQTLNAAKTKLLAIAQTYQATATGAATTAQWSLNAAMMANPIGLIIAAVAALAAGLIYFASQSNEAAVAQHKFNDALKETDKLTKKLSESMDEYIHQRKIQGASEEELTQLQIDKLKEFAIIQHTELKKQLWNLEGLTAAEKVEVQKKIDNWANLTDAQKAELNKQFGNMKNLTDEQKDEFKKRNENLTKTNEEIVQLERKKDEILVAQNKEAARLRLENMKEGLAKDIAIIKADEMDKLAAAGSNGELRKEIIANAEKRIQDVRKKYADEAKRLRDEEEKKRNAELTRRLENEKEFEQRMLDFKKTMNEKQKALPDFEAENLKSRMAEQKQYNDFVLENNRASLEDRIKAQKSNAELIYLEEFENAKSLRNRQEAWDKYQRALTQIEKDEAKKRNDEIRKEVEAYVDAFSRAINIVLQFEQQNNEKKLADITTIYDAQVKKNQEALDKGLISQEQFDKKSKELQEKKAREENKIKHKQFEIDRAGKLIEATINLGLAISQAYTKDFTGIMAAINAVLIGAQIGLIAGQKNPYRAGTAQILSGNSHEGGGISLGQFGTAEGGEMLGILSKKNTKKFGKPMLELFDGINKGNDSKMLKGLSGLVISAMPEIKQGNQIVNVPKQPELSKMLQIMERPQETVTIIGNKKIIKQGNYTRIVHL